MSDIFISYARQDRPRVAAMAKALEDHGWSVWWDRDLLAGETFRRVIRDEISKARCQVVLWSKTSVDSDWVIEEASLGKKRNVLVPAQIDDVDLPLGFGSIQTADLTAWNGNAASDGFETLCASIAAVIGTPANVTPAPWQPYALTNPKDGLPYVWIPPGEFGMGATPGDAEARADEKPRHTVRIGKGLWVSETLVTVAAYKRFASEQKYLSLPDTPAFNPDWSKPDHPMVRMTWEEAQAYCEWAGGTLPTEAQWEYAARGGKDGLKYPWGNYVTPEKANYAGSKWNGTSPVRSYPANNWGLYDMSGNVWEWAADWYDETYYASLPQDRPAVDPTGPDRETGKRVLRGGSFYNDAGVHLRAASRLWSGPGGRDDRIGFRCVWQAPAPSP
jgi:formylglycine-generating enzyme required for sulfatase activity